MTPTIVKSDRDPQTSLSGLADALINEHLIGVAVGTVAVQRQQSPHTALDTLVRIAHRTDRSVVEVARHLVTRHSGTSLIGIGAGRSPDWDVDPAA